MKEKTTQEVIEAAVEGAVKNGRCIELTWIPQKEAARRLGITPRYLSMLDEFAPPRLPQERGKETLYQWPVLAIWWHQLEVVKAWDKKDRWVGSLLIDHGWQANQAKSFEFALERLPAELAPKLAKLKTPAAIQRALKMEFARIILWAKDIPKEDEGPQE